MDDIEIKIANQKAVVTSLELKAAAARNLWGNLLIELGAEKEELECLWNRQWRDNDMDLRNIPGG